MKYQFLQTIIILFVFIMKFEPGKELTAGFAAGFAGIIAAVGLASYYPAITDNDKRLVMAYLISSATAGMLGAFTALGYSLSSWLVIGYIAALLVAISCSPLFLKTRYVVWTFTIQVVILTLGVYGITKLPYS